MNKYHSETGQQSDSLTSKEFEALSSFIYSEVGIKMPAGKKIMLEARLRKRVKELGISSYTEYCKLVLSRESSSSEIFHFIDVVTTNKTDFFREPKQFQFLVENALPELRRLYQVGTENGIRIWSAGCSSGEEAYTLAMVLKDYLRDLSQIRILATDVSTQVLEKALLAIYEEEKVEPVPMEFKKKYLLKSKEKEKKLVRIVPELRRLVEFRRVNFMHDNYEIKELFHAVFCRNVIIYFDRPTQEAIVQKICRSLAKGGYLFIGHSESLFNMDLPLVQVAPSIYRKV
ncbi:MAG: chemotaxis protein CheR [Ignavibacteria bacterium]|jgi:chemotaxis protein methyltransferase CheR|nr:chemotaxis protein CheR [Ignavibacteria bacterium]MCU7504148.1 chemotaxis protein CheR [Ignavibacteria bacterium]MCU7516402.1 chemotaxis protein CheR [Ignavibacteria bacterium]